MEKHEKPYGCTFPSCGRTFKSKNDWKRHENSKHFQVEAWRCNLKDPEGGDCGKVCYREQSFRDHVVKSHALTNLALLTEKVEQCRIGRNGQVRFWCGFCVKLVDLKKGGLDAWTERFDHIDDHFMGRQNRANSNIRDWIPIDSRDNLSAGSASIPPPEFVRKPMIPPIFDSGYKSRNIAGSASSSNISFEAVKKRVYPPIPDTGMTQPLTGYSAGNAPIKTEHKNLDNLTPVKHRASVPRENISESGLLLKLRQAQEPTESESEGTSNDESEIECKWEAETNVTSFYTEMSQPRSRFSKISPLWELYDACCEILATSARTLKNCQGKLDTKSTRVLGLSTEGLLLWGESFKPADFVYLKDWSADLKTSIAAFLLDISKRLTEVIFPLLADSTASKLEPRIAKLSEIAIKVANETKGEDGESLAIDNDDSNEEDDQDIDSDDENEEAENTEEAILDIHTNVQCLLDLVPLMEQILGRSTVEGKNSPAAGLIQST